MAKKPHDNHRKRLRARFLLAGKSFEDHELLELLLFYCIPRVNTNETAHRLLDRFGSIRGVFNASHTALLEVEGIGETAALYIRSISETICRYESSCVDTRKLLDSSDVLSEYMRSLFVGTDNEMTFLILLDAGKRLMLCNKVAEGNSCANTIDPRKIILTTLANNAAFAILVHNHPGGKAIPSGEDIATTEHIEWLFHQMHIEFIDHFIVAGNKCVPILKKYKAFC